MIGNIIVSTLLATLMAKATLEAVYFKDRRSAAKTLLLWLFGVAVLAAGSCFSFLIDYFS